MASYSLSNTGVLPIYIQLAYGACLRLAPGARVEFAPIDGPDCAPVAAQADDCKTESEADDDRAPTPYVLCEQCINKGAKRHLRFGGRGFGPFIPSPASRCVLCRRLDRPLPGTTQFEQEVLSLNDELDEYHGQYTASGSDRSHVGGQPAVAQAVTGLYCDGST